jgi:nicotinamide phosphoribosyltransferase
MPEGSVIRPHIPAFIITAQNEYSRLCTFLETMLTMIWYPSCVATLSRYTRDLIEKAFQISVDDDAADRDVLLTTRLHDFGFRGCTSVEQSVIGGCAHLLSFVGSDTMSACYYAQMVLNGGKPVGYSIPATEHSVMTSWKSEIDAVKNLCEKFPGGKISSVMDAYDYDRMLNEGLPILKSTVEGKGCTLIVRPDSGDAVEQVIKALDAAYKARYANSINKKGFITFDYFAVLQGDGINYEMVRKILNAVLDKGYAASNVAFGMGGGLLQKVNRDTMSFATKLCYMVDENHTEIDVVKDPAGQEGKLSLGGKMVVLHEHTNYIITGEHFLCTEKAAETYLQQPGKYARSMKVVYDGTKSALTSAAEIEKFSNELFDETKARLIKEWELFAPPRPALDTSIVLSQIETRKKVRARQEEAFAVATKTHYESNTQGPRLRTGGGPALLSKADLRPNSHHAIHLNSSLKESSHAILHALEKLL